LWWRNIVDPVALAMIFECGVYCLDDRPVDINIHGEDEVGTLESMLNPFDLVATFPEIARGKIQGIIVVRGVKLQKVVIMRGNNISTILIMHHLWQNTDRNGDRINYHGCEIVQQRHRGCSVGEGTRRA
jgi:hypothetical protein